MREGEERVRGANLTKRGVIVGRKPSAPASLGGGPGAARTRQRPIRETDDGFGPNLSLERFLRETVVVFALNLHDCKYISTGLRSCGQAASG